MLKRSYSPLCKQTQSQYQYHKSKSSYVVLLLLQEGDAYAFGVMVYELYSGVPAWAGLSTGDIIAAKLRSHASTALRMSADAPPALQVM